MLTSIALVLMMTIPGLGLFYGGMVRKKNVGDTVMKSFAITCLVTIVYGCHQLQPRLHRRRPSRRHEQAFLQGILSDISTGIGTPNGLAVTIPEIGLSLLPDDLRHHHAGADCRRFRRAHEVLRHAVVHRPVVAPRLCADRALGVGRTASCPTATPRLVQVLDFAGGTVVHINAGVAGLMCAICLGKRKDMGPPHNMVLTFIGASLLWVGWFGFNAGSAVTAGMQAGMAMTVTQIATAVAAFTWMLVEWICRGKPTVIGICSGAVAGLVAITPASGFVGPIGAMVIGVAAGVLCYWGVTGLKRMLGADDALDCFGVHGVGGIVGALLTGVFAISEYGGTSGLIEGNAAQMINQV